ncbi:MAG TPA: hypothetical protein VFJ84_00605 [Candidatus Saccharimonadales bacterium]|nr:hypothetical protein [Candidatus Saccharimonadales bacterium]
MNKPIADIHVPKSSTEAPQGAYIDAGLANWGRPTLALALAERGMDTYFSRGAQSYDYESGIVSALKPAIRKIEGQYEARVEPVKLAMGSIDAIRNVAAALGHGLPELNHPLVRELARDKAESNRLFQTIELAKTFALVDPHQGIVPALEAMPGGSAVLKPRNGRTSQNVYVATKEEIAAIYHSGQLPEDREWMVEERLDFSPEIKVTGINGEEQEKINLLNTLKLPKELRVYTFGRTESDELIMSFVLRGAKKGEAMLIDDEWIYINPESVPAGVVHGSDKILKALQEKTGVKEVHVAVDWAYAIKSGEKDPVWLPMEINGSEPQLVFENENQQLAREQAGLLADQLYRIASKKGTVN